MNVCELASKSHVVGVHHSENSVGLTLVYVHVLEEPQHTYEDDWTPLLL